MVISHRNNGNKLQNIVRLQMNLEELENQRKALLLKKSEGIATEEDLKQLVRVLDLINKVQPSIADEIVEQERAENLDFAKNSL